MGQRLDRLGDRHAVQYDGLRKIHAGDDADAVAVAHEERVGFDLTHAMPGSLYRVDSVDVGGWTEADLRHPRAHRRSGGSILLIAGDRRELMRNFEVEKRGEARIVVDEAERDLARQDVA